MGGWPVLPAVAEADLLLDGTEAKDAAKDAVGDAGDWIDRFARFGQAARGSVYVLFGVLTVKLALGQRQSGTTTKGALAEVTRQPSGKVVIWVVAVGLLCWTISLVLGAVRAQGGRKPGHNDTSSRLSNASSAVVNAALTVAAFELAVDAGRSSSDGGKQEKSITARVLDLPAGRLLVGAAGLGIIGYGAFKVKKALEHSFCEGLDLGSLDSNRRQLIEKLGVAGHLARAAVFALVGLFVVRAAVQFDPNQAEGLDGALTRLADAGYGPPLLFVVAVGLVAFGLWCLLAARYRRPDG